MMNIKHIWVAVALLLGSLAASESQAQITFTEDFTGGTTNNNWYFFSGACLTAGTSTSTAKSRDDPCLHVRVVELLRQCGQCRSLSGRRQQRLFGIEHPALEPRRTGGRPAGSGALRFTNGSVNSGTTHSYGHNERGAILSASTFPTGAGLQVTFKTITYHGDSGGAGADGADGISFFLQDGSQPPGLGAFGGSLAYSCSNSNTPHDGLRGRIHRLGNR